MDFAERNGQTVIKMKNIMNKYNSYDNFGAVNLLSEVGGNMGLFLNWSLYSFGILFFKQKWINIYKSILKPCFVVLLFVGCILLCNEIFQKYLNEVETMEFKIRTGFNPPYVSICPHLMFSKWMHNNFPCSKNSTYFYGAVKSCLGTGIHVIDEINHLNTTELFLKEFIVYFEQDFGGWRNKKLSSRVIIPNYEKQMVFNKKYGICFTIEPKTWSMPMLNSKWASHSPWAVVPKVR